MYVDESYELIKNYDANTKKKQMDNIEETFFKNNFMNKIHTHFNH